MKLETMMLADAATAFEGKLFVQGGGLTRITAPELPWTQPQVVLVLRFQMAKKDWDVDHEFELAIDGPDGEMVPRTRIAIPRPRRPNKLIPGEHHYLHSTITIASLRFTSPGIYNFRLWLGGEPIRTLPIAVTLEQD
jgi:hypothetical protein